MPLRVAAYCRVSTDREDQANSLKSQKDYFQNYIESKKDWIFVGIFADEGLSGTSTSKREAFCRMAEAAEAGSVDLILTKEVSRFARNTVDALEFTRRFKRWGVGVLFINDNIDTRDNDGELRLTIMASIAQEESRKTSERVKWGQKRRMEAGVVFGNNTTYGFETKNGKLFIRPEQAEIVRLIYHKFLNEGKGTYVIARELMEDGIQPPSALAGKWSSVMIRRILSNEKYAGDLLQKKYVTLDYLTHKKVENRGQEEQVYIKNHHKGIIDRETWEAARQELTRRGAKQAEKSKYSNRYWCSGKIVCGHCGGRFIPRVTRRPNGEIYKIWGCRSRILSGGIKKDGKPDGCKMRMVNDKSLLACMEYLLQNLQLDYEKILLDLTRELQLLENSKRNISGIPKLESQYAGAMEKKERVMDAYFCGAISKDDMLLMKNRYEKQMEQIKWQIKRQREEEQIKLDKSMTKQLLTLGLNVIKTEEIFSELVEKITVYETYMEIKLQDCQVICKLSFTTSGRKERYTTHIEKFELAMD